VRSFQDLADSAAASHFFSVDGAAEVCGMSARSSRHRRPEASPPSPVTASSANGNVHGGGDGVATRARVGGSGQTGNRAAAASGTGAAPDLTSYDTLNSPFLDLQSPFTCWCAISAGSLLLWGVELPTVPGGQLQRKRVTRARASSVVICRARSRMQWDACRKRPDIQTLCCREAVKMALLLPLLLPRMLLVLLAVVCLATCSYIAVLGWCEPQPTNPQ